MASEYYTQAELANQLDHLDDIAFEQHKTRESLEIAVKALEDIIQVPYTVATDARAIKEAVRIAMLAIYEIEEQD